jgi:hypothetical protein
LVLYAYLCVFVHSRFVENPPIWSWETKPLIFEVVLLQHAPTPCCRRWFPKSHGLGWGHRLAVPILLLPAIEAPVLLLRSRRPTPRAPHVLHASCAEAWAHSRPGLVTRGPPASEAPAWLWAAQPLCKLGLPDFGLGSWSSSHSFRPSAFPNPFPFLGYFNSVSNFKKFIFIWTLLQNLWNWFRWMHNFELYPEKISNQIVASNLNRFPWLLGMNHFIKWNVYVITCRPVIAGVFYKRRRSLQRSLGDNLMICPGF